MRKAILVTKFFLQLLPIFMKPELVSQGFQKSFDALDIGYIDLYLVHTPLGYVHNGKFGRLELAWR